MAKKRTKKRSSKKTSTRSTRSSLSADHARDLSDRFEAVADALREFRRAQAPGLTNEQIRQLRAFQLSIVHGADMLTTVAVGLELDSAAVSLEQLQAATDRATEVLETIQDIKKAISLATAVIELAGAIMSKDIGAVAKSAANVFKIATEEA